MYYLSFHGSGVQADLGSHKAVIEVTARAGVLCQVEVLAKFSSLQLYNRWQPSSSEPVKGQKGWDSL